MSKIIEIRAPKTLGGESVTEGIVKIKKNVGESVKVDDLIFEIETDKTALELTAEASGQITEFLVKEDDVISPDQLLAMLSVGEVKEEVKEDKSEAPAKKDAPSARKIMEENVISAGNVKGTGMGGRITKADLTDHMNKAEQPAIKQYELPRNTASGERKEERVKMSKIRQVIAARLKASQNTVWVENLIRINQEIDSRYDESKDIRRKLGDLRQLICEVKERSKGPEWDKGNVSSLGTLCILTNQLHQNVNEAYFSIEVLQQKFRANLLSSDVEKFIKQHSKLINGVEYIDSIKHDGNGKLLDPSASRHVRQVKEVAGGG